MNIKDSRAPNCDDKRVNNQSGGLERHRTCEIATDAEAAIYIQSVVERDRYAE